MFGSTYMSISFCLLFARLFANFITFDSMHSFCSSRLLALINPLRSALEASSKNWVVFGASNRSLGGVICIEHRTIVLRNWLFFLPIALKDALTDHQMAFVISRVNIVNAFA